MEIIRRFLESHFAGLLNAILSTIFSAMAHFMAQIVQLSSDKFSHLEMIFVRGVTCFILLTPPILYSNPQILFPRKKWINLIALSLSGFTCFVLLYMSLPLIPLATVLALTATCPFFAIIFSYFILGDKCFWQDGLCGLLSFAGVLLIARPEVMFGKYGKKEKVFYENISYNKYEFMYFTGCMFAVLFGMIRALFLVFTRKWKNENPSSSPLIPVLYPNIFYFFVSPTIMIFKGDTLVLPDPLYARCALFTSGILSLAGLLCLTMSLKTLTPTIFGVIRNLDIIWAFLLQYTLLNINASIWEIAGSIVIVASTILISLRVKLLNTNTNHGLNEIEEEDEKLHELPK